MDPNQDGTGNAPGRRAARARAAALLGLLGCLAAAGLAWGCVKALGDGADLLRRAEEVALFVRGENPYADPDMTYPPSAPPVFTALIAPVPASALRGAWLVLNLLALAALVWAVARLAGRAWPSWLVAAFGLALAASKPVRGGIGLGQFHLIPTALVAGSLLAMGARRQVAAGLMLGIALIKPTMALPFLAIPAARGRWRTLATASAVQGVLLAGTSAWLGIGPMTLTRQWLRLARGQMSAGAIDLPTLLSRAWPAAAGAGPAMTAAILVATLVAAVAWRSRSDLALAAACGAAAVTFSYHRFYDLVLLAFPLAYLFEVARRRGGAWIGLAAVFAALLFIPEQPFERAGIGGFYEAAFAPLVYVALAVTMCCVAMDRDGAVASRRNP